MQGKRASGTALEAGWGLGASSKHHPNPLPASSEPELGRMGHPKAPQWGQVWANAGGLWKARLAHRVALLFGSHVGVAVTPVKAHLLLLLLIQPHQLFGSSGHKTMQAVQEPEAGLGGVLWASKEHASRLLPATSPVPTWPPLTSSLAYCRSSRPRQSRKAPRVAGESWPCR